MTAVDLNLDGLDVAKIHDVVQALNEIDNLSSVRLNKVEFTIYGSDRVIMSRKGRWQPLCIRGIKQVLR